MPYNGYEPLNDGSQDDGSHDEQHKKKTVAQMVRQAKQKFQGRPQQQQQLQNFNNPIFFAPECEYEESSSTGNNNNSGDKSSAGTFTGSPYASASGSTYNNSTYDLRDYRTYKNNRRKKVVVVVVVAVLLLLLLLVIGITTAVVLTGKNGRKSSAAHEQDHSQKSSTTSSAHATTTHSYETPEPTRPSQSQTGHSSTTPILGNVTGSLGALPTDVTCPEGYVLCSSGVQTLVDHRVNAFCIMQFEMCDGYQDCIDGSDELNCTSVCPPGDPSCNSCRPGSFRCRGELAFDRILGTKCLRASERCDGYGDCTDSSDEVNCTCGSDQFRCVDGFDLEHFDFCVPMSFRCDQRRDCSDGSDEDGCIDCPEITCPNGTMDRALGGCIKEHQQCDGHVDCLFGHDELGCPGTCADNEFSCNDSSGRAQCLSLGYKCDRVHDCADSWDERACDYSCTTSSFMCVDGPISRWPHRGFCLNTVERCNDVTECVDGSDEDGCGLAQCSAEEFRCVNGTDVTDGDHCLPISYRCDMYEDCSDASDEDACTYTCAEDQFMCTNGTLSSSQSQEPARGFCVMLNQRCDSLVQCSDGSDESNCTACPTDMFSCGNGTSLLQFTGHRCIPSAFRCDRDEDCSNGLDEVDCSYTCPAHKVACNTGIIRGYPYWGYCIWEREVCDGHVDCMDNSDEVNCSTVHCPDGQFKCHNGTEVGDKGDGHGCVYNRAVCDGHAQCADASDELGCNYQCSVGFFTCSKNRPQESPCIPAAQFCDGITQCIDGSDERMCSGAVCEAWQFKCANGHSVNNGEPCIDADLECDKVKDCTDGSDERNCSYECQQEFFLCKSGVLLPPTGSGLEGRGFCLLQHFLCDHVTHCTDESDEAEEYCEVHCEPGMFRCVSTLDKYNFTRCIPGNYRCDRQHDCQDGSDEEHCDYTCPNNTFMCVSGIMSHWPSDSYCIPLAERCDGFPDCQDNSDEHDCNTINCIHDGVGAFVCKQGFDRINHDVCIPGVQRCDKVVDCTDGSDEEECDYKCPAGMSACQNGSIQVFPYRGYCLYPRFLCDGINHCLNSTDELDCDVTCSNTEFKCITGGLLSDPMRRCVAAQRRCDETKDCIDGSDEDVNVCRYTCTDTEFKCRNESGLARWPFYGRCIAFSEVCDNFRDCFDGSDEWEENCGTDSNMCPEHSIQCANSTSFSGEPCINQALVCDRHLDCISHSDELNCNYICPSGHFACAAGTLADSSRRGFCLPLTRRCNGINDCQDWSDEVGCNSTCSNGGFHCGTGGSFHGNTSCVSTSLACDGKYDCVDHTDEADCEHVCNSDQFRCVDGPVWYYRDKEHWCIPAAHVCDGNVDCIDRSDESQPQCNKTCPAGHMACGYIENTVGALCVAPKHVCNKVLDCQDGADERFCSIDCPQGQMAYAIDTLPNLMSHMTCTPLAEHCDRVWSPKLRGRDEMFC